MIPVFIDDMKLASKSEGAIETLIVELLKHFKLHNLGTTTRLLRMKIDRDHSCHLLSLSQQRYTLEVLQKFGMADCKPVETPKNQA